MLTHEELEYTHSQVWQGDDCLPIQVMCQGETSIEAVISALEGALAKARGMLEENPG